MIHIDDRMILPLTAKAKESPRKRKNLNFHLESSDPLQRMLHAMGPETYVQPHKHENPDKREAFVILRGRVAAIEFTPLGAVSDWIVMDPATGCFGVEFTPRSWHCLIALATESVVYEVKDGPWDPADDKNFASWAPKEGDAGCEEFKRKVLSEIGIG
jgi:cupin fold WbuC family metalloprotein